jgi:hypothetical protein
MSVKCGNHPRDERVYHDTPADVRACYESNPRTLVDPSKFTHMQQVDNDGNPIGPRIPLPQAADKPAPEDDQRRPVGRWERGQPLPFPEGRYAVLARQGGPNDMIVRGTEEGLITKFYKVDAPLEGRWAGYVFLKVQASDDLHDIRSRDHVEGVINSIIAQGWKECLLRYGREIGRCGHCGRTLTNEESRAYGIGPVCRRDPKFANYM